MKFQGAVVKERGMTFAVVVVIRYVIENRVEADKAVRSFQPLFPGLPIVLMAQDGLGTPSYYGRSDIARFLANVPLQAIPWKEYSVS